MSDNQQPFLALAEGKKGGAQADMPDGWLMQSISDVLAKDRGISVGVMYPGKHNPSGLPLVTAGDLSGGHLNRQPEFRISEAKHEEYPGAKS